jgi:hypothetical protein
MDKKLLHTIAIYNQTYNLLINNVFKNDSFIVSYFNIPNDSCFIAILNIIACSLISSNYVKPFVLDEDIVISEEVDIEGGIFFWDSSYTQLYISKEDVYHEAFFDKLVARGVFSEDLSYFDIPRGSVNYIPGVNVLCLMGGSFIDTDLGKQICRAFGYEPDVPEHLWTIVWDSHYEI